VIWTPLTLALDWLFMNAETAMDSPGQ